jgi:ArsR family transcriptional regulator
MGASKSEQFSDNQNQIASIAKAFGHPARIAIIEYLLKVDSCICGDIVNELPLSQPTVSQHLRELKSAGLIKGNIEGNAICYCIEESSLDVFKQFFEHVSIGLDEKKKRCC